jgi:hypothetical protein
VKFTPIRLGIPSTLCNQNGQKTRIKILHNSTKDCFSTTTKKYLRTIPTLSYVRLIPGGMKKAGIYLVDASEHEELDKSPLMRVGTWSTRSMFNVEILMHTSLSKANTLLQVKIKIRCHAYQISKVLGPAKSDRTS